MQAKAIWEAHTGSLGRPKRPADGQRSPATDQWRAASYGSLKNWLAAQAPQPATLTQLQALLDDLTTLYNEQRPHRPPAAVVEAGCKAAIGQRLKQSGMHWTVSGADAIIALRCTQASEQMQAIYRNQHNQTGAAWHDCAAVLDECCGFFCDRFLPRCCCRARKSKAREPSLSGWDQLGSPGSWRISTTARTSTAVPKVIRAYRIWCSLNVLPMPTRNRTAARNTVIRM